MEEYRVEKVVRILISNDPNVAQKVDSLFKSKPDSPIVVPFHHSEINSAISDEKIFSRIRAFTFSRDLFSMSSPLRTDLYFYGRSQLINEICSKLSVGENFSLFGLRRSGKTSIAHGVDRALRSRGAKSIIIDCQSPSVHQRRWNELLYYIVQRIKIEYSISASISSKDKYTEADAAELFLRDMSLLKSKSGVEFLVLIFDEIERIAYGTASSPHWNGERDFLLFWQAVRSGFQTQDSPYTFFIVGTNPSCIETAKIFESDNPLFGNVEKRYIPMLTPQQVFEMVSDLGSIMGVELDEICMTNVYKDFGGHPFLTRYACSYIARLEIRRPVKVDRTTYSSGLKAFDVESSQYVSSVVENLRELYEDEFEMLKFLGVGDLESFAALALSDKSLVEHLSGYGLIEEGSRGFFFRIGVVEAYFERLAKPVSIMSTSDRWRELSEKRNQIEVQFRDLLKSVISVSFHPTKRKESILSGIREERRSDAQKYTFEELVGPSSKLYLSDIQSIVEHHWGKFQNVVPLQQSEFKHHIAILNKHREDAHAKTVSDHDLEEFRVSFRSLQGIFG